ncbi:kinase-like protein, partial [Hymenopellis radicata]
MSLKIINGSCLRCPFLAGTPCRCVISSLGQTSTWPMTSHRETELPLRASRKFNAASQALNPLHDVAEVQQFPEIASHTPVLVVPSPVNAHQLVTNASIRTSRKSSPFRWVRGNRIGSEPYAQIYRAINISSGKRIVVKQVQTVGLNETLSQTLRRLSDTLQASDHPNVLDHLGFEQTAPSTNIFLEYFPGQTLRQFLEERGKLGHSEITKYFLGQIVSGLVFLHSKDIVHWDLRTDNIFVDENGRCKISGFSIGKYINNERVSPADRRVQPIREVRAFCAAPEDM